MQKLKQYRIVVFALVALISVFVYFSWKVRSRRYTQSDYENDIKISEGLGLDCKKFEMNDIVGRNRSELDRWAALKNSILLKGAAGEIQTGGEDPEFTKEVHEKLGDAKGQKPASAESGEKIETQTYTICGLRFVAVLYGDKIVDAIFIAADNNGRKLFGIEQ